MSLVAALEEYLHDPNFEQNRLEYKRNMAVTDGAPAPPSSSVASAARKYRLQVVVTVWS